jgi:hypothetical protein
MDGTPTQDHRGLRVERGFEQNRLAGQFLADAYERVVPIHRRAISSGGRIKLPGGRDEARQESIEGRRLEAGGCR